MRTYPLPIRIALLLLALVLAAPISATGASKNPPTRIDSFVADPGNQLTAGTEIVFTVEGTPKGKATVKISGIARTIKLDEVDSGSYEGSYTVRSSDKIAPNATARATLKARGKTAVADLALNAASPPAAAAPPPAPPPRGGAKIERFAVAPVDKIEPGVDLRFTLEGTPGGRASVGIQGVNRDVPLKEVKSGVYEGTYTIRKMDNFPPSGDVVGRLQVGDQTARNRLSQSLLVNARPPVLKNLSPREGETVQPGPLSITGTFDDSGGIGIDPKSVRVVVDGRDVTARSSVTPQFFTYRTEVGAGSHRVEVNARDASGNNIRHAWNFTVGAPAAAAVPLQIVSHANNANITAGPTEIRGRTAPGAQVDVKVTQTASVAGLFGVNQEVFNQTVRADENGNFSFRFQPQISVPGARYEVTLKARTDQATRDMQLVLFQQR